jgi:glycosyltransferase involved in cell wall biosynthesis
MDKKRLTIIIPTKNEDSTLIELLECLEKQTFSEYRVIVADDSDTNRVQQICNARNIICIKGGLPGKARNNGVMHTDTEYVFFLDADINIKNNFLKEALSKIEANNMDCMSFGFFPNTSNSFLKILHWIAKTYFHLMTNLGFGRGIGGAILVKKKAHDSINGFDETITVAEDHNYLKRISLSHRYSFSLRPRVKLNTRRFMKYGIFKMSLKYFCIEMYRIFIGEIRNNKIPYFENPIEINDSEQIIYSKKTTVVNE